MRLITYENIKYFQSNLLKDNGFQHAFFTKTSTNNVPIELQKKLHLSSNIHYLNQVHSNVVIQVNNTLNLKPKSADCLITKDNSQSLWIYTADCIPILIADTKTRNVAACHCGLKGLKKQIISRTFKSLKKIGSKKNDLIIAIGACITGENYQVEIADVDELISKVIGKSIIEVDSFYIEINSNQQISLFKKDTNPDKLLFDIQAAAILQLFQEGIKPDQININRICTYSNSKLFNSFRRDRTKLRQWNCIYS